MAPDLAAIRGIPRLIREVIANLLTNAAKYTPPGGRIDVRAANTPGGVRLEVEDNGIGIAADDQGRLFKEFARIRTQREDVDQSSSSGLGLSIVRRILEAHGGRATVISTPGKGSVFAVELPAAGAARKPEGKTP
jgi:signal transduction histidine kinase